MQQDGGQRIKFRGPVSVPSVKACPSWKLEHLYSQSLKLCLLLWAFLVGIYM